MQQNYFAVPAPIRFKHFTRKGYALFACLGRVVIVGTLSASTLTHARAEGISVRTEEATDSLQRTELKLDEVVVTGSRVPLTQLESAKIVAVITRDDVQRAAATSVNDILKLVPGVDVRQRGGFGVQTDISVRGGNFDQITILLNGVPISSPHTGHLSADFPVSPDDIERIEVLEGPAARIYGTAAFNGVVNIVTTNTHHPTPNTHHPTPNTHHSTPNTQHPTPLYVHLSGGSYGYANANAGVSVRTGALQNNLSGGYTRTDGATPNSEFTSSRVFYQGSCSTKIGVVNGQVGYSYKPYAANTFYGASSTDQWESNERIMAAVNADLLIGKVHLSPQAYWNRWFDHYQWHKDNPAGENYHKVDAYGGSLNAWIETSLGRTSIGTEIRRESIWSTKLGEEGHGTKPIGGHDATDETQYKFYDARNNVSAFLEHVILLNDWTVSMGVMANRNTGLDSKWRLYPGVDVSYRPTEHWKFIASWNMALRMPTFTDLYYSGANIEGNRNLKPEKTSDFNVGARYTERGIIVDAQVFYSHKTDMIDWATYVSEDVQHPTPNTQQPVSDGIFHSLNFQLDNKGVELNVQYLPREVFGNGFPLRSFAVRYTYINEDSKYDVKVIQSKYAMDYLRHKVCLSADGRLWQNLNLSALWRWQERTGNNAPYALLDAKLSWDKPRYSLYVDATNILNKQYFDYVSIPQPGRCFMAGVKFRM